jgi:hypothetical protein
MKAEGYDKFSFHWHSELWNKKDAKNPRHGYGTMSEPNRKFLMPAM